MIYREPRQGESFQRTSSSTQTAAKERARGLWTLWTGLWLKRSSLPIARISRGLIFFFFISLLRRGNGLAKVTFEEGTCPQPFSAGVPQDCRRCFACWWSKCGGVRFSFGERRVQWCGLFSLGLICCPQDEMLHQDFTCPIIFKADRPVIYNWPPSNSIGDPEAGVRRQCTINVRWQKLVI